MDVRNTACPSCEAKTLETVTHSLTVEHQGELIRVDGLEGCRCTSCGADPVLMPQIRANQNRIADAKRQRLGLLTGREILAIREALGLSQSKAAEAFRGGANAFSKYERGEVIQSAQMDKLLRAAMKHPDLLADWGVYVNPRINYSPAKPGATFIGFRLTEAAASSLDFVTIPNAQRGEGWFGANDDTYLAEVGVA